MGGPVPFVVEQPGTDPEADAALASMLRKGRKAVEDFFDARFPEPVRVLVFPSRETFTASFPVEWDLSETQCWIVASGVASTVRILSPSVWREEACEHDPGDSAHVQNLVIHELTHAYHGQFNPTRDFTGMEEMGWFMEGLAVYVSGQLREGHMAEPREALELGLGPAELERAWSGKYRYGVSGSIVEYVDATWGREALATMLAATTESELLAVVGVFEDDLLRGWRDYMLREDPARARR
jgi:hypothetical protein